VWCSKLLCLVGGGGVPFGGKNPPLPFVFHDVGTSLPFRLFNGATGQKHLPETMLGGVVLFDYDADGWLDIYAVNGASLPGLRKTEPAHWNRLYRNEQQGRFRDVTKQAGVMGSGYGIGAASGDYDNDGYPDLFVAGPGQCQLFRNRGDGTFEDRSQAAFGTQPEWSNGFLVGGGFFDANADGRLDLLVVRYLNWSPATEPQCTSSGLRTYCAPGNFKGLTSVILLNRDGASFQPAPASDGLESHDGKGMSASFADYDQDGRTDIFQANDTMRHFLFRNEAGRFAETALPAGVAFNEHGREIAGMGSDFRDWNNDGRPDLFVTGTFHDSFPLYRNDGKTFTDVTSAAKVAAATVRRTGWGNGIFDFDNDGWKDLFAANSAILDNSDIVDRLPYQQPNLILQNRRDGTFGVQELPRRAAHRGAAFGDLNNDGQIDIVTSSIGDRLEVLLNHSAPERSWLLIRLVGRTSNRQGLGAEVCLTLPDGTRQWNHATTAVGYASASDPRVHFGLGANKSFKKIEVRWPGGIRQSIGPGAANRVLTIEEAVP
jgi:enediyne biosynthesis protein E4